MKGRNTGGRNTGGAGMRWMAVVAGVVMAARAGAMRAWAEGRGMRVTGGPVYYFYDAPWTPGAARLNELAWELR